MAAKWNCNKVTRLWFTETIVIELKETCIKKSQHSNLHKYRTDAQLKPQVQIQVRRMSIYTL